MTPSGLVPRWFTLATAGLLLSAAACTAPASTPGGGADVLARSIGQKLSEALGQPVVIDNKPSAGGIVAANSSSGVLSVQAASINTDGASVFMAQNLVVNATFEHLGGIVPALKAYRTPVAETLAPLS